MQQSRNPMTIFLSLTPLYKFRKQKNIKKIYNHSHTAKLYIITLKKRKSVEIFYALYSLNKYRWYYRLLYQFTITGTPGLGIAQSFPFIFFVFGIRSFKEKDFGIAFKCQNMCTNAVEKPAAVRYDNGASCKVF